MTIKLDIAGEALTRVRKRRSPHRSGRIRKPVEPRGKITREVINDARETIMNKKLQLTEISKKKLLNYIKKAVPDMQKHEKTMDKVGAKFDDRLDLEGHPLEAKYANAERKVFNREKGIKIASNRLTNEETVETPVKKKSIQEMYKKDPISADLVGRIMSKITPEVLESLGPLKPAKGEQSTKALGPKKPKSTVDKIKDSSLT